MCYYEQTRFNCGDWKWGNMKERCVRQHRIGETCGYKLAAQEHIKHEAQECRICRDIGIKTRRRLKELENIERWTKDGRKFQASIEKAEGEVEHLTEAIRDLEARRPVRTAEPTPNRHNAPQPTDGEQRQTNNQHRKD